VDPGTFAFGRTAEIRDEDTGEVQTWTIVGPTEADREHGKLSAESPIARALIDQPQGAVVSVQAPRGERRFKILQIR
jgi:transcription elongation GreA/GreB family factor